VIKKVKQVYYICLYLDNKINNKQKAYINSIGIYPLCLPISSLSLAIQLNDCNRQARAGCRDNKHIKAWSVGFDTGGYQYNRDRASPRVKPYGYYGYT